MMPWMTQLKRFYWDRIKADMKGIVRCKGDNS